MWLLSLVVAAAAADIHAAVGEDSPIMIREAIEAGESVNTIGQGGQTPLMAATLQGKAGACVETYAFGPPSCTFGLRYQPPACCEYQRHRAAWPRACRTHRLLTVAPQVHAVEALLAAGADATIGEGDGYTPMHGAGFQGRGEVAKLLIVHGLDPSDVHSDGYTPLHRSCWGGEQRHTDMAKVLLAA